MIDQPVSMISTTHTVHLVNHLNPGTTYSFYVYATNQYLRGFISEEAEAQTQSPTPPTTRKITGPPRDVKVEAMSSEALRVTWREPALM